MPRVGQQPGGVGRRAPDEPSLPPPHFSWLLERNTNFNGVPTKP